MTVDFKWIDNPQRAGDIMDLYGSGDVAPEGRFRYRYTGSRRVSPDARSVTLSENWAPED